MAITKIWSVKSRLDLSLSYISNPDKATVKPDTDAIEGVIKYVENKDKTENCLYVKGFNCSKDKAYLTMKNTQKKWQKSKRKNGVIAFHMVQSFSPGEVTPELAYKCGEELIEKLFADRYEVVLATHINKGHIHNHIILNAVSFKDGRKYRRTFNEYFKNIRGTSDEICRKYSLSVIENPKSKAMHYAEWKAQSDGKPTIRGQMRAELDEIIKSSYTLKDFWTNLEKRGYVVHRRGKNIKYTSVVPPYGKRAVRLDNLGKDYSEEAILERIKTSRNGIRTLSPTEMYRAKCVYQFKKHPPKKLKGFQALYFKYLYLFKKIRKKQTPQRVSFFMRDELIKLERYQKQFKFIVKNKIESGKDLQVYQTSKEEEMERLISIRKTLYDERNDENCEEVKAKAHEITKKLYGLRSEVKMCKEIFKDSYRISERKRQAQELKIQSDKELNMSINKRKNR